MDGKLTQQHAEMEFGEFVSETIKMGIRADKDSTEHTVFLRFNYKGCTLEDICSFANGGQSIRVKLQNVWRAKGEAYIRENARVSSFDKPLDVMVKPLTERAERTPKTEMEKAAAAAAKLTPEERAALLALLQKQN